jgi:hypothetical protein
MLDGKNKDNDHVGSETTSLNCDYPRAYCLFPRWQTSLEKHGGMKSAEENIWFIQNSSLAIVLTKSSGSKQEKWEKEMNFYLQSFRSYLQVTFNIP